MASKSSLSRDDRKVQLIERLFKKQEDDELRRFNKKKHKESDGSLLVRRVG